jgi:hypothetical protein
MTGAVDLCALSISFLLAGGVCGFLWELWNFRAGLKWAYTVPFVGSLEIFEMPLLGFLGFSLFALECYVMVNSFHLLIERIHRRWPPWRQLLIWSILAAAMVLFDIIIFPGIDRKTVDAFKG